MTNEEQMLRSKFYLAPKNISLKELKEMDQKYTAYPGLTLEQARELYSNINKLYTNK